MKQILSVFLVALANTLLPVAILTFGSGFFPYKPFLPGLAQYADVGIEPAPDAPFDRLVFMVVDALRSDFVYSHTSGFEFTQRLISSGAAIPFTAHATSPTITMPRVKAITTGSIPSFLDVILNFAESDTTATLAQQDTWLAQMQAKEGGKLVMYGDDTWLKLFPSTFTRADGTSSFFVSDFSEVDNNVTRHIPDELERDDWNAMILHYLGLDHIGHKTGPRSPHMIPKQKEMDHVVQQIYEKLESETHLQSTLFVLCGDHGMNDAGNHGGSSAGETSPALVFISPKLKRISSGVQCPRETEEEFQFYSVVEQSDLAPTLAGLLGFPVPRNNLGVFIPDFLPFWKDSDKVQLVLRNARQILDIVKATFANTPLEDSATTEDCNLATSSISELACRWAEATNCLKEQAENINGTCGPVIAQFTEFSRRAQEVMSNTASNYDVSRLNSGMVVAAIAAIAASFVSFSFPGTSPARVAFLSITVSYGLMMFASSFVEEEQHFWYWSASGWFAYLYFIKSRTCGSQKVLGLLSTGSLIALRVARRWNQTGQKFAGEPDIAKSFLSLHNPILWGAVLTTYFDILQRVSRRGFRPVPTQISSIVAITLCLAAFSFKVSFTNADAPELVQGFPLALLEGLEDIPLVMQARAVFLGISIAIACALFLERKFGLAKRRNGRVWIYHDLLTLFLITQSRVTNIPLFLLFELQFQLIDSLELSLAELTTTSLLFQYLSFFAFGGSNAISSIDLSNGYNGVSGYNVVVVGILTFVSNWAGPIWWTSATNLLLVRKNTSGENSTRLQHVALLSFFITTSLLFVMIACTVLRAHLFIWTVFSPKYLYSMVWSLAHHLCINIVGGSALFWLAGGRYQERDGQK